MQRVLVAEFAILAEFNAIRVVFLVFHAVVVSLLALAAGQCDPHAHGLSLLTVLLHKKINPLQAKGSISQPTNIVKHYCHIIFGGK